MVKELAFYTGGLGSNLVVGKAASKWKVVLGP